MLFRSPINRIDATGVETFARLRTQLSLQQRELWLVGAKLPVEQVLRSAGEWTGAPGLRVFVTEAEALAALRQDGA